MIYTQTIQSVRRLGLINCFTLPIGNGLKHLDTLAI